MLHDLATTVAHVRMLAATAVIDKRSADRAVAALEQIREELSSGASFLRPDDVDIHVGLERRLAELIGDDWEVVRLCRSRNDRIATDIRLWLRDKVFDVFDDLNHLRQTLLDLGERDLTLIMPGYTHMQPAMPILLSHWWLAHEARFRRDFSRLIDFYGRLNCLPLGAGVLAGTSQPVDRDMVAELLGFDHVIDNSLDAVSDRDFFIEFASFAALVGTHVSQLSGELLLWATQEFGFVKLRKPFVFRSANMPHKRNPELLEMLRSRPSLINGRLAEFLSQLKGLPMGYSQDLQEALPGLLEVVEHLRFVIELTAVVLTGLEFDAKRMKEMASRDLTNAGNALDFLISRGIDQEKAAKIVDSLVNYCRQRNKYLSDLALSEWQQFSPAFDNEIYGQVTIEESVGSLSSYGGTSEDQVSAALDRARGTLLRDRSLVPRREAQRIRDLRYKTEV